MNIAIAGRRLVGRDAECDDLASFGGDRGAGAQLREPAPVRKHMVGREHRDERLRIARRAPGRRGGDGGRAVAALGSSRIVASAPISRNCSATRKRYSLLVMTTVGSKIDGSARRVATAWNVERSPMTGMNCLGRLSRNSGHMRVPEPPHMITGRILVIGLSRSGRRRRKTPPARPLCMRGADKAMPRGAAARSGLRPCGRSAASGSWRKSPRSRRRSRQAPPRRPRRRRAATKIARSPR